MDFIRYRGLYHPGEPRAPYAPIYVPGTRVGKYRRGIAFRVKKIPVQVTTIQYRICVIYIFTNIIDRFYLNANERLPVVMFNNLPFRERGKL